MAGGQERVLRRRIKSVQSTKKITKAMELIAASRIARAQSRIAANLPYREGMRRIIIEAAKGDPSAAKKMLGTPERVDKAVILVVVGDRGLSGAYNSSVLRATERVITELVAKGTSVHLVVVGKKGGPYFRFRGQDIESSFQGFADRPEFSDAQAVALAASRTFVSGEAQQVLLVSTRFLSASTQRVETRQLLPLVDPRDGVEDEVEAPTALTGYVEFEPEAEQLLGDLAPKALESEVFTALLEGSASFHTSQQRAMAAATENADELSQTLSRIMNRARQDAITTEIMEIVGGAEALRQEKGA
jgi:F-type H+-transporting ATPase subunit gamma